MLHSGTLLGALFYVIFQVYAPLLYLRLEVHCELTGNRALIAFSHIHWYSDLLGKLLLIINPLRLSVSVI